jgi:Helix-turn-helix domain
VTVEAEPEARRVNGPLRALTDDDQTVSVSDAARLLARDRTRVYALLRSGDLVAAPADEDEGGPVRIVRASLERWLVAGGARGGPLSPRNCHSVSSSSRWVVVAAALMIARAWSRVT